MNKQNFMEKLESLLSPISAQERELALQYYENYFEDAGEEKEAEVIAELGTPEDVAKIIFEEVGFKNESVIIETKVNNESGAENESVNGKQKSNNTGKVILWATAIIWMPIWIAIILVIALGLFPTVATLVLVFSLLAVIFAVIGIACVFGGLFNLFTVPAFGVSLLGSGLVLIALSILFALFVWFIASIVFPALAKSLTFVCKLPFYTKEDK